MTQASVRPRASSSRSTAVPAATLFVAVVLLVVATVLIVAIIEVPPDSGLDLTALATGLAAAACAAIGGTEVLRRGWHGGPEAVFRRWIGAAMLVWAAGRLLHDALLVADLLFGGPAGRYPPVGDLVSFLVAPLAAAAAISLPRQTLGSRPAVRIVLDAGLLGGCTGLLIWRSVFNHLMPMINGSHPGAVVMLLCEVVIGAVAVVVAVRDPDLGLIMVAVGALAFVTGAIVDLHAGLLAEQAAGARLASVATPMVPPTVPTWTQLLWLLSWPPIAWGALHYRSRNRSSEGHRPMDVDPDARVTVVTTSTSLLLLGVGVVTIIVQDLGLKMDPVSWALVLAAIGLLWVRELLNTRLRLRLMGRLHQEATSDPLTGLPNRRVLTARLSEISPDEPWCLLAFDLDGFKGVNDLLGHAVGDRLLCAVGERLSHGLPPSALVSRTGGDEFAVLIPGRMQDGVGAAHAVLAAVRRSCWDVEGVTRLPVTASVGVTAVAAQLPVHTIHSLDGGQQEPDLAVADLAVDPLSALSAAGAALQLAKAGGRDRIEVFDGAAALMRSRRLRVEERLRAAIAAGEIDVRFQPIVELRTGVITGVEALARWVDSRLGTINPQEFIPVAEQTGLVVALGEHVLHRSLEQARLHDLPQRGIRVACNVSPLQLRVPTFHQMVEQALAEYALPPPSLVVEVTEAVLVEEDSPAVLTLRRLAEAGVTIAIDDFGTGYSALGYLRRMPAQVLKIDRSLTVALIDEPQARAITRAVVDLGSSLGMSIVVEGIETSDVADLVSRMGVSHGQGTLYGSAMTMVDIVRLSRRPTPRDLPA